MKAFRWVGPMFALAFLVSGLSAQDPKKGTTDQPAAKQPDKPAKDKKEAVDKLINAGQMTGKVVQWSPDDKTILLDVKLVIADGIDEGVANNINNKQQELIKEQALLVATPRNKPQDQLNHANRIKTLTIEIQKEEAKLIKYKEVQQQFELKAADDVKVRTVEAPPKFDDKGFPAKRTAAEMKELRGTDPRVPGYKAEIDAVKEDLTVMVMLVRKATRSTSKEPPAKAPDKSTNLDKDPPIKLPDSLRATVILIGAPDEPKKP